MSNKRRTARCFYLMFLFHAAAPAVFHLIIFASGAILRFSFSDAFYLRVPFRHRSDDPC